MATSEAQKRAMHEYYLRNKERFIERAKKWQEENRELQREYSRNYNRRRRANMTEEELLRHRKRQMEYYYKSKERAKHEQIRTKEARTKGI